MDDSKTEHDQQVVAVQKQVDKVSINKIYNIIIHEYIYTFMSKVRHVVRNT